MHPKLFMVMCIMSSILWPRMGWWSVRKKGCPSTNQCSWCHNTTISLFSPVVYQAYLKFEMFSILTQIQGFHKNIKLSSQLKSSLNNVIASCTKLECKVGLVYKVSTRWSSTQSSLSCFVELRVVLVSQFNENPSLEYFQRDYDK